MSFPVVLYGPEGKQFSTYAYNDERWPLGSRMVVQQDRTYRFARKSGTAATAGSLQQAAANTANHVGRSVAANAAIGARSIDVLLGNTSTLADEYKNGLFVIDTSPGNGYAYLISSNAAVAVCGTQTINLAPGHSVQVALTTVSVGSLIHNPYRNTVIYPVTATQVNVGVAVKPITACAYGWLQTRGPAAVLTEGTVVLGDIVVNSSLTAGAAAPSLGTCALIQYRVVGWVGRVSCATLFSNIYLNITD